MKLKKTRGSWALFFLSILSLWLGVVVWAEAGEKSTSDLINLYMNPDPKVAQVAKVAILPWTDPPGNEHYGTTASLLFAEELKNTHKYQLLSPLKINQVLASKRLNPSLANQYINALEVGRELEVDGILSGSLSEYGRDNQLPAVGFTCRLIMVADGRTAWGLTITGAPEKIASLKSVLKGVIGEAVQRLVQEWQKLPQVVAFGLKVNPILIKPAFTKIWLTWPTLADPGIKEYNLYRAKARTRTFSLIQRFAPEESGKVISFVDKDVHRGENYVYKYNIINQYGFPSKYSPIAEGALRGAPSPPTGFNAKSGEFGKVTLGWQISQELEVKGYRLYRASTTTGPSTPLTYLKNKQNGYVDSHALEDGKTYYYKITAYYDKKHESQPSEVISATTNKLEISAHKGGLTLKWAQVPEATGYNVYRKRWLGKTKIGSTQKNSYQDVNLQAGKVFQYQIVAYDETGHESEPSPWVEGIPQ